MKKIIDKEYVRGDIAQLMVGTNQSEIIMDDKEIILLKVNGKVVINKYLSHKKRNEFPYADVPMHVSDGVELYNVLFDVNKNYLIYEMGSLENNIIMNGFSKLDFDILWNHEVAPIPDEDDFEVITYTREEIEKVFDGNNYDVMCIVDKRGDVMLASSKKDGNMIKKEMLPSKDMERQLEGKAAQVYGGMYPMHTLISVKNGVFSAYDFSLAIDKDGTYVMDRIDILLPDVSYVHNLDIPNPDYEKTGRVSIK